MRHFTGRAAATPSISVIIRQTFALVPGGGAKHKIPSVLQHWHCSEVRAGIRDGDGMKKSGSKHHTKAGPGPEAGCCHPSTNYECLMFLLVIKLSYLF